MIEEFEKVWHKANDGRDFIHPKIEEVAKRNAYRYFLAGWEARGVRDVEAISTNGYITGGGYYSWVHGAVAAIEKEAE